MGRSKKFVNPELLLNEIVQSDFDLAQLNSIDDSDFPKPPNFLEWMLGRDYCNATLLPWQIEAAMHLFSEYCPTCSDPRYTTKLFDQSVNEIRDHVSFLDHGVCPKCKKNKLELFTFDELANPHKPHFKNELTCCVGQRSGKSKLVVSLSTYQLVRWLKIPDPLAFYGLPKMEVILGTFSALSAEQAEENLWIPFRGLFDESPWFKSYNKFLKEEGKKLGINLADVKESYILYPHKRIMLSFTGSDDRKKRGRTRLWGAIDEIAFLNSEQGTSKNKVMDADKNYAALNNSLSTLRQKTIQKLQQGHYDLIFPTMYNASSPYNAMDKIMRLVKTGGPWAAVFHRSTWESNPDYTEQACRSINPGLSQMEYERDFGAIPPYSDSPYIAEPRVMEKLCFDMPLSPVEATPQTHEDGLGDRYLYLKANVLRPDKNIPRLLSLDNGYNQNAFAACLFRYDAMQKKPVLEAAFNLYPDKSANLTISFPQMFENFILPIVKGLNIKHVFYDRWQSLDQIQRLRDLKINAQAYSLNYEKDFLPFKQMLVSSNMILPKQEMKVEAVKSSSSPLAAVKGKPITNLIWQALTVRQVGKKLLKPLEGDDDVFRAFALGGAQFLQEDIVKQYAIGGSIFKNSQNSKTLGSFQSMGSGKSMDKVTSASGRTIGRFRGFGR